MRPTEQQSNAITINTNCVVAAGAGSGKTGVLSQRFSYLVKNKLAHCDEILTITFTNKATSEMHERIYKNIVELNMPEELERFSNSAISTVDGFCSKIVRSACSNYGIANDFTMMDKEDLIKVATEKAYSLLNEKISSKSVQNILKYENPDAIAECFAQTAEKNINITSILDAEQDAQNYLDDVKKNYEKQIQKLKQLAQEYIDKLEQDSLLKENVSKLKAFINNETEIENLSLNNKLKGSKENQELVKELKKQISLLLEDCLYYDSCLKNTELVFDFYSLFYEFAKRINDYKKTTSQLTFSDVMALTLDILIKNKDIRSYYKNRFKYVMIDEFQDNNDDYRKLLYLISEKQDKESDKIPKPEDIERGKIFLVGDQKQSIYRFRGADVSVFKKMKDEIELSQGKLLKLDKNFRSTPSLVKFFNRTFENVMQNKGQDFESDFEKLDFDPDKEDNTRIIFNYFEKTEDENKSEMASLVQSEAYSIASLVEEMLTTDNFKVKGKRPHASDIALLLRNTTNQGAFEKAFRLKNIPYVLNSTRALSQEALVNDFFTVLELCIYPDDEISQKAFELSPLYQNIDTLKQMVAKNSISECISYIWNEMGYRHYIITNPSNAPYSEHYLWLLSLASYYDENSKSIIEFLDYLRPLLGQQEKIRDLTVQNEESDGVNIMTIHSSKGLQFPIVILASMERGDSNKGDNLKAVVNNNKIYLPCSVSKEKRLTNAKAYELSDLETQMSNAELKRLFYVALTRAENHLVLSTGSDNTIKEEKDDGKEHKTNMTQMLLKAGLEGVETRTFNLVKENLTYSTQRLTKTNLDKVRPYYKAQPDNFDYSKKQESVTGLSHEEDYSYGEKLPRLESDPVIAEYNLQTEFGTYVHSIIENRIKNQPVNSYSNVKLNIEQLKTLNSDANTLAECFLNSNLYQGLKNYEIHSERAFIIYDSKAKTYVEGAIDFYAVGKEEVVILDFKTDLFKNEQAHKAQLEWYEKAIRTLYPDKKVRSLIVYLRLKSF